MWLDNNALFNHIMSLSKDMVVGFIGGGVGYLLKYSRDRRIGADVPFSLSLLLINIIVGGYAAYMFGSLFPGDMHYRDFIIGATGVASYPILQFIEFNGVDIALYMIEKLTGIKLKVDKEEVKKSDKQ